ncbi:MAG: hypothetical protein ABIE25_06355 [Thermoplasmatota archaeon]
MNQPFTDHTLYLTRGDECGVVLIGRKAIQVTMSGDNANSTGGTRDLVDRLRNQVSERTFGRPGCADKFNTRLNSHGLGVRKKTNIRGFLRFERGGAEDRSRVEWIVVSRKKKDRHRNARNGFQCPENGLAVNQIRLEYITANEYKAGVFFLSQLSDCSYRIEPCLGESSLRLFFEEVTGHS